MARIKARIEPSIEEKKAQETAATRQKTLNELAAKRKKGALKIEDLDEKLDIILDILAGK